MKTDKKLQKLIDIMVKQSFDKTGKILNVSVRNYSETLTSLNRSLAIVTLSDFSKKLKRELSKHTLFIEGATKFTPGQINTVKNALRADYKIAEVKVIVNPNLLGGTRIKIGDLVIEDSVVNKIEQISQAIRS